MSMQDDAFERLKELHAVYIPTSPNPKECSEFGHVYKEYVGLTERYDYCARCDKKRSWEESQAVKETEKQRNDNWDNVWKTYRP